MNVLIVIDFQFEQKVTLGYQIIYFNHDCWCQYYQFGISTLNFLKA
jgi:hypothetical protein